MPDIRPPGGDGQHEAFATGADPDRWVWTLHRTWSESGVIETEVFPMSLFYLSINVRSNTRWPAQTKLGAPIVQREIHRAITVERDAGSEGESGKQMSIENLLSRQNTTRG